MARLPQHNNRCIALLGKSPIRCPKEAVSDGFCGVHHPLAQAERAAEQKRRERSAEVQRAWIQGGQLFWCQVAICALLQYLQKASPEYMDALARKL